MLRPFFLIAFLAFQFAQLAPAADVPVRNGVAQDHFVWPKELFSLDWNKYVQVKVDLPYLPLDDGPKPTVRSIYYLDLNDGGEKEMIAYLGPDGVTSDFAIFQHKGHSWQEIGTFIGLWKVCEKANGYYQLEAGRHFGGGSTARELYRFVRGKYRLIRTEEFERGVLSSVSYDPSGMEDEDIIYDRE
jgi:hypothetical protein